MSSSFMIIKGFCSRWVPVPSGLSNFALAVIFTSASLESSHFVFKAQSPYRAVGLLPLTDIQIYGLFDYLLQIIGLFLSNFPISFNNRTGTRITLVFSLFGRPLPRFFIAD